MERSQDYGNAPFWWSSSIGSGLKEVLEGHKWSQNVGKRTGESVGIKDGVPQNLRKMIQLREGELLGRGRERAMDVRKKEVGAGCAWATKERMMDEQ